MAASPAALSAELWTTPSADRAQTRRAAAELLHLFDQLVELAARVLRRAGDGEAAHLAAGRDRVAEERELRPGEGGGEIRDRHAAAQVRLVGSVLRDRLRVRQPQERPRRVLADEGHQPFHQRLERREDEVLGRERDLEVDLRELRLAIGAQVLVAEALDDLKVPVHAGDHQDLLEDLRRLRQREELAGMHAARHEVVARPFRRGLGQHRRFDLEEPLLVEVLPDRHRRAMAHDQVALHARAAQVDVAVLEARLFGDLDLVGDHERRRLRLVQQADLGRADLDRPGRDLRR